MDRLEAIRVFAEVARLNSFSVAVKPLGQSLATTSRKVTLLEVHLSVQLLTRTIRSVKLTDAGRTYLAGAGSLLDSLERTESDLTEVDRALSGNLTITTPGPFGRNYVVPLNCRIFGATSGNHHQAYVGQFPLNYVDAGVDIGIRIGRLRESGLKLVRLGDVHVVACASPADLEKHRRPKTPADLRKSRTVAYNPMRERVLWNFTDKQNDEFSVESDPIYRADSIEAIFQVVVADGCIGFFHSYQVVDYVAAGRLSRLLIDCELKPRPVSLLYPEVTHMPVRVRSFIKFATPRLIDTLRKIEDALQSR